MKLRAALAPRPEPLDVDRAQSPKPNGWHTYHVCGGLLRETTSVSHVGGPIHDVTCVHCGEWFEPRVTPVRVLGASDD